MAEGQDVSAVIINFRTPDLTLRAVRSLRSCYETLPLLLIDNGSRDSSEALLRASAGGSTELLLNARNIHHGPAMDQALRHLTSAFVLFLDSDIEMLQAGFVERMRTALLDQPQAYAIGKRIWMNHRGFDVPENADGQPYIRPICMLLRRNVYFTLPPFERHGAPCLSNMREASRRGLHLLDFPVEEFIRHRGRGTAARHGYRLGVRGKLNHLLNRLGL